MQYHSIQIFTQVYEGKSILYYLVLFVDIVLVFKELLLDCTWCSV